MVFPKSYKLSIKVLLLFILISCEQKKTEETKTLPNLILIIADDMNWDDSGAYGNTRIRTPNIDKLATEGMRFT
jgi:N-sulfoglucosamine sulfohydrolase